MEKATGDKKVAMIKEYSLFHDQYNNILGTRKRNCRSFLWFPIPQWQNKTFCKFWYFDSGKGLKLLVTIIVTGNNKWFTSFCFLSWFRKNEMWRNKTFQLNIKSWHRDDGLLQPIMFPNIYCTVLSYFQSQTVL